MSVHVPIKGFVMVMIGKLIDADATFVGAHYGYSLLSFIVTIAVSSGIVYAINIVIISKYKDGKK